jgi:hypothetical protein
MATFLAPGVAVSSSSASVSERLAAWETLLVDVIVLSVRGDASLAQLLAGGDFDGDRVWLCWEPRLVLAVNDGRPAFRGRIPVAAPKAATGPVSEAAMDNLIDAAVEPGATVPTIGDLAPQTQWSIADMWASLVHASQQYALLSIASNLHLAWLDRRLHLKDADGV